jgi:hypothetical protein
VDIDAQYSIDLFTTRRYPLRGYLLAPPEGLYDLELPRDPAGGYPCPIKKKKLKKSKKKGEKTKKNNLDFFRFFPIFSDFFGIFFITEAYVTTFVSNIF